MEESALCHDILMGSDCITIINDVYLHLLLSALSDTFASR
jgi:hypothetical protein